MKPTRLLLAFLVAFLVSASTSHARPAYKKALAEYYGPFLSARLNDCTTCHQPVAKEDAEDRPHNAFGARLKAAKKQLSSAGKKADLYARLPAVADEDSDGDGAANLIEILTGHNPGDPADRPSADELARVPQTLAAFKARGFYRFDPFAKVQRPALPSPRNSAWVRNPIDAFLAVEHEQRGLKPRPEAPRHVLVRRVYLDLIGLPPTREELAAALGDSTPDWYEKLVDHLLNRPQYGERWGRHWMDVWRYADWAGYGMEVRESHRHIWHWRDWIVESLNADKGYDRMIGEMLAGDELAPDDPATLRATGFLVRHWYLFNRNTWLENVVEHTGKAFLGITMNCARCHDHFFDPITQQEYYQFRAVFEPYHVRTDRVPGEPDLNKAGIPRAFDAFLDAPTWLFNRGNEASPDKSKSLPPGVPSVLNGSLLPIEPVKLPLTAHCPDKRDFVIQETLAAAAAGIPKANEALTAARPAAVRAVAQCLAPDVLQSVNLLGAAQKALDAVALAEVDARLAQTRHAALTAAIRAEQLEDASKKDSAEWKQQAEKAAQLQRHQAVLDARKQVLLGRAAVAAAAPQAKAPAVQKIAAAEKALAKAESDAQSPAGTNYTRRPISYPQAAIAYGKTLNAAYPPTSTGRRLALARWIVDRDNPLAARVAVNHIWLRHFGQAIVPTVFDFGQNGQPPTHPALLDWLASEFMDPSPPTPLPEGERGRGEGWSMKRIHRLIVTSSAYRMDSLSDPANAGIDRDNRCYWRMNTRRLEAELVRDSVLHLSGQLDLTLGGADIPHALSLTSRRRSIYLQHASEKQAEFLTIFDAANITECYQRSESIVPQQALALSNSTLVVAQARLLATRLTHAVGDQPADAAAFVRTAFEQILGRPPSAAEQSECEQFLVRQATLLTEKKLTPFGGIAAAVPPAPVPHLRARENLVQVLMNHNDFITIR